jgi:hypothetical protein
MSRELIYGSVRNLSWTMTFQKKSLYYSFMILRSNSGGVELRCVEHGLV